MDDAVGLVHREHRLQRLALEGQLAVGVVLEDPEAVLGGELDQAPALLGRERAAGRVVGVGDDVGELDRPLGERRFERAEVEPVGLQRHRHQLDPELLQEQQRAVVGRLLDDDPVAGPEQVLEQHRAGLERAVGDHHLGGIEVPVPLRDPLAEPRMADPDPVGERRFPVAASARAAASRTCSWGRMSALGAPRANEIVSPAIGHSTLATAAVQRLFAAYWPPMARAFGVNAARSSSRSMALARRARPGWARDRPRTSFPRPRNSMPAPPRPAARLRAVRLLQQVRLASLNAATIRSPSAIRQYRPEGCIDAYVQTFRVPGLGPAPRWSSPAAHRRRQRSGRGPRPGGSACSATSRSSASGGGNGGHRRRPDGAAVPHPGCGRRRRVRASARCSLWRHGTGDRRGRRPAAEGLAANDRARRSTSPRSSSGGSKPRAPTLDAELDDAEVPLDDPALKLPVYWPGKIFQPGAACPLPNSTASRNLSPGPKKRRRGRS